MMTRIQAHPTAKHLVLHLELKKYHVIDVTHNFNKQRLIGITTGTTVASTSIHSIV